MSNLSAIVGFAVLRILREPSILPSFREQFRPQESGKHVTERNLNAAFLLALGGGRLSHPALGYLNSMAADEYYGGISRFYLDALERVEEEMEGADEALLEAARYLSEFLKEFPDMESIEAVERYWCLFYPEGTRFVRNRDIGVGEIRERRTVKIRDPNPLPITSPHEEILFTSNLLLTLPLENSLQTLSLDGKVRDVLKTAVREKQAFWYDHPVPVGIPTGSNEAVYGLTGFDRAIGFEIMRGNAPTGTRMPVLLSISATHRGLMDLSRSYLSTELDRAGGLDHLNVFAVTEKDVRYLIDSVLIPAAHHLFPGRDTGPLSEVLGVDGEYGRHYSFLKAAAALWQVLVDGKVRATFKFDLDQVFPQQQLVSETGRSAFEHLSDPLWGSVGVDNTGREVEMGMLAGALVNEEDLEKGLFTPDVRWPDRVSTADQWIFASAWPQAASTEAEMMARYDNGKPDGARYCYQRVHVTGGTTGILIEALRKHRPFTPGWIGRAEDQAYIMPILFPEGGAALRYVHASGLFMRHDKKAFASQALDAARIGKMVGDYVRILAFTSLARALPWELEGIKGLLDPFTGSFISRLPVTVSCLRMALQAAGMFSMNSESSYRDGGELVRVGTRRLNDAMGTFGDENLVRRRYSREKAGWDLYYDVLDALEKGLENKDQFSEGLRDKTRGLVEIWRVK